MLTSEQYTRKKQFVKTQLDKGNSAPYISTCMQQLDEYEANNDCSTIIHQKVEKQNSKNHINKEQHKEQDEEDEDSNSDESDNDIDGEDEDTTEKKMDTIDKKNDTADKKMETRWVYD